jgi:thiamine-phosphate pyrophosphorylase
MTPMRGLYPIVDLDSLAQRGVSPLLLAESALTARPPLLQLRAKHQTPRVVLELLLELKPMCERAGTLLFANDRPDLALLAGTAGVHVGQDDVPLAAVRRLSSTLQVGVSTHDLTQLERALEERPDYVAFGPIFATRSKHGADPALGIERVAAAAERARAAGVPLVVIGGLTLQVAPLLAKHGVCAAVISDLLAGGVDAASIAAHAAAWQTALGA